MKTSHPSTLPSLQSSPASIRVFIPAEFRPQPTPHTEVIVNEQRLLVIRRHPRTLIPLDPLAAADRRKCRNPGAAHNHRHGHTNESVLRGIRGRFMTCQPVANK